MVVEHSKRRADNHLAVVLRIPRDGETRRPVVFVARKSLLHAHRVLRRENVRGGERDARQRIVQRQRWYLFGDFVVVTHAVVQRDVRPQLPRILREERERLVADAADRIAKALNEVRREAESVLLHRREIWRRRQTRRTELRDERARAKTTEVE